jgi:hypothetical protein
MFGRRRHPRHEISNCKGTLRVLCEVTVQHADEGHLVAISDEPRTCGEVLTIELMNGSRVRTPVRVTDCSLMVENGSIRHRVRLMPIGQGSRTAATEQLA